MDDNRSDVRKSGRTFDSAYGFSFAIGIGLILFIAGLVISLTLGEGTSIGLIFGIPLLIAGLIATPDHDARYVQAERSQWSLSLLLRAIKTSDATIRLRCPACET